MNESVSEEFTLIETSGSRVGVINGLSVLNTGEYSFGRPSRITVTTSPGNKGIVNIEREVDMSGSIHNKGILILGGYLSENFAQDFVLSINAYICFEQNYGGVDGDSASSAELYALLSSLSDIPIKQNLAVTGSINQYSVLLPQKPHHTQDVLGHFLYILMQYTELSDLRFLQYFLYYHRSLLKL